MKMKMKNVISKVLSREYLTKGFTWAVIGGTGSIINWTILYILTSHSGVWYVYSEIIATVVAFWCNYSLLVVAHVVNITGRPDYFIKAGKIFAVGLIGIGFNWTILYGLTQYASIWYLYSEIIATFIVFLWNYNVNIMIKTVKLTYK